MPEIQGFVSLATSQLGVSEETTRSATGGLLSFIGDKVDAKDFQGLLGAMPGADALAQTEGSDGGGGVMGAISGLAGYIPARRASSREGQCGWRSLCERPHRR